MSENVEVLHNPERLETALRCDFEGDRHVMLRANDEDIKAAPAAFAAWAILAIRAATMDELPPATEIDNSGFVPVLLWRP